MRVIPAADAFAKFKEDCVSKGIQKAIDEVTAKMVDLE